MMPSPTNRQRRQAEIYWLYQKGWNGCCVCCGRKTEDPNALGYCGGKCLSKHIGSRAEAELDRAIAEREPFVLDFLKQPEEVILRRLLNRQRLAERNALAAAEREAAAAAAGDDDAGLGDDEDDEEFDDDAGLDDDEDDEEFDDDAGLDDDEDICREAEEAWDAKIGFNGYCLWCGKRVRRPNALGYCGLKCLREHLGAKADERLAGAVIDRARFLIAEQRAARQAARAYEVDREELAKAYRRDELLKDWVVTVLVLFVLAGVVWEIHNQWPRFEHGFWNEPTQIFCCCIPFRVFGAAIMGAMKGLGLGLLVSLVIMGADYAIARYRR